MIKKSLVLFTAVIMGATSLTNAADIRVFNKDKNKTGQTGSTIYVKVGNTVKEIQIGKSIIFTLPSSPEGFAITASKTRSSVNNKRLTGTIYTPGYKLSYWTVKNKPKVQIDVTNKIVTASK